MELRGRFGFHGSEGWGRLYSLKWQNLGIPSSEAAAAAAAANIGRHKAVLVLVLS